MIITANDVESQLKNTLILAMYVNIGNLTETQSREYLKAVKETLNLESAGIFVIYIPTRDETTRVECVYPKYYVVEDKNDIVQQQRDVLEKLTEQLKKITP